MSEPIPHWIGGKRVEGRSGRVSDVHDPATGQVTGAVGLAAADEVDEAVGAAREALHDWSRSSLSQRAKVLFRFRELVDRHRDELAALITAEHGKVAADAGGEVQRGLEVAEFACGIPHLLKGAHSTGVSTGVHSHELRQPVGVCAGVTPFNFPVMVPMWMHPIAIACGNAFVLKPSERDPSASLRMAELWADAGLPDGVFNVLQGDAEAVSALLRHPGVDAISFVGSTPVARHIYETAAAHGKRVQALGGAKNHLVVLPDADVGAAVDGAVGAAYGSAGERCMAISVVVAVGDVADEVVDGIADKAAALRVGPGANPQSEMGPLITEAHRDRVAGYVDTGVKEGAELRVDGRGCSVDGHQGGFWLGPTLFDRVRPGMRVYTDEIFGPVLCVVRAESYQEAADLVSSNPYGNGVALYTRDGGAAQRFSEAVPVGMIGVNVPIPVPMAYHSFGGWKDSLFGDAPMHGERGVSFYTRMKTVTSRWPAPETPRRVDLGFPS